MTTALPQVDASRTPAESPIDSRAAADLICGFCATGCSLSVTPPVDGIAHVTPTLDYPVNTGAACPKGWESLAVMRAADRGTTPLLRDNRGRLRPVPWQEALRIFVKRMKEVQRRHGTESIAFLGSGQIVSEEIALLGCLAKFGMGMRHGDSNTRQCMATAVAAYKESFGFDAPPYTYEDLEESDVIVLVGSNLCVAHPILWRRVLANPHSPQVIVVDPRTTETAMAATEHVALAPKSDMVLFYGLARLLFENDWIDGDFIRAHTSGVDAYRQHVAKFTPDVVHRETGIASEQLLRLARIIHRGRRVSFWWTMGVNQSYQGVRTAQSIINLALITGNLGRPGTGANSITGQCNAMGSRLFGNTTNLIGGHDFSVTADRRKVARILGIDAGRIPRDAGWPYHEIVEGILRGDIRGLWVVGTNPAHSWINQNTFRDILGRLDFLVVQDLYRSTETARAAHLYLPAAGWGEKEGTFINSERRLACVRRVVRSPGEALSDFAIFRLVAEAWGCGELFRSWSSPEAAFGILRELTRGQPCDITGIRDYRMIAQLGGIQWPFTHDDARHYAGGQSSAPHHRRLFGDGTFYHRDGRAQLLFADPTLLPEQPNTTFPYLLLTGRGSAAQWHTQTRTSKSPVLRALAPRDVYVEVHADDAKPLRLVSGQEVIVESPRGRLRARAVVTRSVPRGSVFIPMHYEQTNQLTHAHFDPISHQPSYKDCAVRLRHVEPWDER